MKINIELTEPENSLEHLYDENMESDFVEKDRFTYDPLVLSHVLCDDDIEMFDKYFEVDHLDDAYERCVLTDEELEKIQKFMGIENWKKHIEMERVKSYLTEMMYSPTFEKPWLMTVKKDGKNYERCGTTKNELKIYENMLKKYENNAKIIEYILENDFVEVF